MFIQWCLSVANIRPACVCVCGETSQSMTFDFDSQVQKLLLGRCQNRCQMFTPAWALSTSQAPEKQLLYKDNKQLCTVLASPTY